MSNSIYGKLKLDRADLDLIGHMLERGMDLCTEKTAAAQDDDEAAFYLGTRDRSRRMLSRFEESMPGSMAFTESDLTFVRGMVFPTLFPELMAQYGNRTELSAEARAALSQRIDHLTALQAKFDRILMEDTSQDADEDEEEDEEEDDDDMNEDEDLAPTFR